MQTDREAPFKIVIAGGGTAGWMTAAYLRKALSHRIEIQLIESATINTIGVGEATFSYIHLFFEFLELCEDDWMPDCNASYKTAIRFVNWNAERRPFYHPFQRFDIVQGRSVVEWWLKLKPHVPVDYACFTVPSICDAQRSPRYLDGRPFDAKVDGYLQSQDRTNRPTLIDDLQIQYPYAYHFDASLLARFLTRYARQRGVEQILDEIVDVQLTEDGSIGALHTKAHGPITADLFIDCTGFRGLLINKTLQEPFIPFQESLPCDRAIAMQVPSDPLRDGLNPYTTATALSAGWVWDIPLFHRIGTGYVYSGAHLSPEEAEREFRAHLGPRAEGCNASHITMRVGRNVRSWVKNCVAIGLASGFVEPLESTGIFFIQHGIEQLLSHFPRRGDNDVARRAYNKAIAECIDGVREFLTLHYVAGTRADTPFWRATKHELAIPDGLAARLRLWRTELPTKRTIYPYEHGFTAYSYCVMLLGLGMRPEHSAGALDYMADGPALAAFDGIERQAAHLTNSLPPLYEYLSYKYGAVKGAPASAHG